MENPSAFPMGEPNDGFAQYFVGQSYLAPVLETPQIAIHNVTFEPGCRNNWHIHHNAAQVLIAVGGCGYYQIEGQEPKELKAGQAVCIPADTKHWHGAAPGESCSHLAFMVPAGDPASMSNPPGPRNGGSRWMPKPTANLPEVCCSYMEGHPAKVGWPFLLFRAITV